MCTGFVVETIARRYLAPIVAVSLLVSLAVHGIAGDKWKKSRTTGQAEARTMSEKLSVQYGN
jgi:hypothetical protein